LATPSRLSSIASIYLDRAEPTEFVMSVYRLPVLVAALAVIALGVPCKVGAADDDTCGTDIHVDDIDSGELHLLQTSLKLAEMEHKAAGAETQLGEKLAEMERKRAGAETHLGEKLAKMMAAKGEAVKDASTKHRDDIDAADSSDSTQPANASRVWINSTDGFMPTNTEPAAASVVTVVTEEAAAQAGTGESGKDVTVVVKPTANGTAAAQGATEGNSSSAGIQTPYTKDGTVWVAPDKAISGPNDTASPEATGPSTWVWLIGGLIIVEIGACYYWRAALF